MQTQSNERDEGHQDPTTARSSRAGARAGLKGVIICACVCTLEAVMAVVPLRRRSPLRRDPSTPFPPLGAQLLSPHSVRRVRQRFVCVCVCVRNIWVRQRKVGLKGGERGGERGAAPVLLRQPDESSDALNSGCCGRGPSGAGIGSSTAGICDIR
jgi:hypothetical protein